MASQRSHRQPVRADSATQHSPQPIADDPQLAETLADSASLDVQAAALSKTNDTYHGGVAQREAIARRIQRRMGNRHMQRVVSRAQQQDANRASPAIARMPFRGAALIQRIEGSQQMADGSTFEVKMPAITGDIPAEAPHIGKHWGVHGTITFTPSEKAALSNKINLIQIAKTIDLSTGSPTATAVMTSDMRKQVDTVGDKKAGVEGDFHTDVYHDPAKKGGELHPSYAYNPVYGYHRSNEPGDIKAAQLTDTPGIGGDTGKFQWTFETVARGDDNLVDYGTAKWGFVVDTGKVNSETVSFEEGTSATFKAALEKHRDFYIHEPVTFYFGFDQNAPLPGETNKIDTFLDYLSRHADVQLSIEGFADIRGNEDYNLDLGLRRCDAIKQALIDKGVAENRISNVLVSSGKTSEFTNDKAAGEQDREELRRWNRRVTVSFQRTGP